MNSVKKNAILNIIKQICTILFPLITFPYAARVLHADNYGVYTFSSSIISYIVLLAGLGISNYAIREGARIRDNDKKISSFINEVFSINILSTILAYIVLFLLIAFWDRLSAYTVVILVLSLNVIFTTIGTDWINVIYEDYEYITKRYIYSHIFALILLFLIVRNEGDVVKYAISTVAGTVVANIANIFYIRKKFGVRPRFVLHKSALIHIVPILVLFSNSIASTIYLNSDVTILGVLKDDYAVAIYGVSSKIYSMVKAIANAAIIVIIPRVSSLISHGEFKNINELYKRTLGTVILLVIPAAVGLISLSSDVVLLIAGNGYTEAYLPLIILSFALPFATCACLFINGVLIPYRREKVALVLTLTSAAINVILNFVLIPTMSFNATAITTLIAEIFMCIGGYISTIKLASIRITREFVLSLISSILVLGVCLLVSHLFSHYLLRIFISIASSVAIYVIFLCCVKQNTVYDAVTGIVGKIRKRIKK